MRAFTLENFSFVQPKPLGGIGERSFVRRISDLHSADARERRQLVEVGAQGSHNVSDSMAAHTECVRDERTVATPGDGLRAHNGAGFMSGIFFQAGERRGEFASLHVIGKAAKT